MTIDSLFGKYKNKNTFVHKMDARLKIFGLICLMVACFLPYGLDHDDGYNYFCNQFLILGLLLVLIIILMICSKVSFKSWLKSLSALWFMAIFLSIIMVFIPNKNYFHILYSFSNGYTIYYDGILQCAQIILRIVCMISLTLILTSTTAPMDLTESFDWYFSPLKIFHIPTQIFSMILSLTIRIIPTIMEESNRIMKAQKSRGVEFDKGFLASKIRSITTLIVPLLISCFSKSNDMSLAMYARGYDPYKKRSKYKVLKFHFVDLISIIVLLLILAFFIFICVYSQAFDKSIIEVVFGVSNSW